MADNSTIFAKRHLTWIHAVERMAGRRLTKHEILSLRDVAILNGVEDAEVS